MVNVGAGTASYEPGDRELIAVEPSEAYLDPCVRAATSPWHQLPPAAVTRAVDRLRRDLADGWWDRRYGHLRRQAALDVGLRLVSAEAGVP